MPSLSNRSSQILPAMKQKYVLDYDRINSWWKPHWENRKGESIEEVGISKKDLELRETFKHNIEIDFL